MKNLRNNSFALLISEMRGRVNVIDASRLKSSFYCYVLHEISLKSDVGSVSTSLQKCLNFQGMSQNCFASSMQKECFIPHDTVAFIWVLKVDLLIVCYKYI